MNEKAQPRVGKRASAHWALSCAMLATSVGFPAHAQGLVDGLGPQDSPWAGSGPGDGVYGRFDGDFSLSLGVGAQLDLAAPQSLLQAQAAVRAYQTIGVYGSFAQGFDGPVLERTASVGALIEPLFLLRWANDAEWGRAFWDLTLDSLSLSVGAHFDQPVAAAVMNSDPTMDSARSTRFGQWPGIEAGLGLGVPLLARAPGPWLRARGLVLTRRGEVSGAVWLTLQWQLFFFTGILEDSQ